MFHNVHIVCPQCHQSAHLRIDARRGEATCQTCALVVRSNMRRDDGFAAAHGGSTLGSAPLTLTSTIGSYCNDRRPTNGVEARKRLRNKSRQRHLEKMQQRIAMDYHKERFPYLVNGMIDELSSRMGISGRVGSYAKCLLKQYLRRSNQPVRKTKILAAVLTLMASRRLGRDRSFESFVQSGLVRKRELGLHFKKLSKIMNIRTTGCNPSILMKPYFSCFDMTPKERRRAEVELRCIIKGNKLGGRSPKSLIAVALYKVLQLRASPVNLQQISSTLGIAPNTSLHCLSLLYKKE